MTLFEIGERGNWVKQFKNHWLNVFHNVKKYIYVKTTTTYLWPQTVDVYWNAKLTNYFNQMYE